MMKKKNQMLVSLSLVALLGGCSEEEVQRDVYNSLDDCLADWQRPELCEAEKSDTANAQNNAGPTANVNGDEGPSMGSAIAGAAAGYMLARAIGNFMGPAYHPGNRAVSTPTGQVIQPQGNRSVGKPVLVKGGAGSANSKPVSRGGFSNSHAGRSSGG